MHVGPWLGCCESTSLPPCSFCTPGVSCHAHVCSTLCACAATSAAKQRAQDELQEQGQAYKQAKLEAAQASAQQAQQQRWEVEKATAQLAQQATKHTQEVEFLEGEVAGLRQHELHLREQVAVQQEQVKGKEQQQSSPRPGIMLLMTPRVCSA